MICNANNETIDFPHELLLTESQVSKPCKAFINNLSGNIKLSKTHVKKTIRWIYWSTYWIIIKNWFSINEKYT